MNHLAALTLTLLLLLFAETPTARPAPKTDYRADLTALRAWRSRTVTVSYAPERGRPDPEPQVRAAIAAWNAKVGGSVMLVPVKTGGKAHISFVKPGSLPGGAIGRTQVTYRNSDQTLLDAAVEIDDSLSDELSAQVIAHELGHALGIEGHSDEDGDLMFERAHLPLAITDRDAATIRRDYPPRLARQ